MGDPKLSRRARAFLGAPALALVLAACGGGDSDVASIDTTTTEAAAAESTTTATEAETTTEAADSDDTTTSSDAASSASSGAAVIQQLSADEAIANAEANIDSLEISDNVLDIEVLAVGDGSVQTLRNVVTGDRPVLLWFFSPH